MQVMMLVEICYVSFTNKAVDECVARVRQKFKGYDEDAFSYFRTLHSLARQQFAEIPKGISTSKNFLYFFLHFVR